MCYGRLTSALHAAPGRPPPRPARRPCRDPGPARTSATAACSSRSWVCSRTVLRNHCRNVRRRLDHPAAEQVRGRVGEVGGDGEQLADRLRLLPEHRQRQRVAPSRRTRAASSPPCRSARRPAGGPGTGVSQYGSRFFLMPVSEAMLSTSPSKPQLHTRHRLVVLEHARAAGSARGPARRPCPAAPLITRPSSTTPPPRPVPTIAATDERVAASAPKCRWWAYSAAALASLL